MFIQVRHNETETFFADISNTRIFTNIIKFHQIRLKDSYWTFSGNFVIFFYLTITWLLDSFIMHLKSRIFTLSDEVKNKQKVFHANIITLETSKWTRLFSFHKNSLFAFTQKTYFRKLNILQFLIDLLRF